MRELICSIRDHFDLLITSDEIHRRHLGTPRMRLYAHVNVRYVFTVDFHDPTLLPRRPNVRVDPDHRPPVVLLDQFVKQIVSGT